MKDIEEVGEDVEKGRGVGVRMVVEVVGDVVGVDF